MPYFGLRSPSFGWHNISCLWHLPSENVFLLMPLDSTTGSCRVLFPSRDPLEGRDPAEFKGQVYWVPNPTKATVAVR
jgi:hypothetical protein